MGLCQAWYGAILTIQSALFRIALLRRHSAVLPIQKCAIITTKSAILKSAMLTIQSAILKIALCIVKSAI